MSADRTVLGHAEERPRNRVVERNRAVLGEAFFHGTLERGCKERGSPAAGTLLRIRSEGQMLVSPGRRTTRNSVMAQPLGEMAA